MPPSLTIASLENEARAESVICNHNHAHAHGQCLATQSLSRRGSSTSLSAAAAVEDELIVLRKDDLNTLLTAKPTVLIGRELVRMQVR